MALCWQKPVGNDWLSCKTETQASNMCSNASTNIADSSSSWKQRNSLFVLWVWPDPTKWTSRWTIESDYLINTKKVLTVLWHNQQISIYWQLVHKNTQISTSVGRRKNIFRKVLTCSIFIRYRFVTDDSFLWFSCNFFTFQYCSFSSLDSSKLWLGFVKRF